jgi:hypothetical protein
MYCRALIQASPVRVLNNYLVVIQSILDVADNSPGERMVMAVTSTCHKALLETSSEVMKLCASKVRN